MKYKDKLFSVLGDSVSTLEGASVPEGAEYYTGYCRYESGVKEIKDTWWGRVIECLGGKLLVNNSISGSTAVYHPSYEEPNYGCSDERTSCLSREEGAPDVIMVFLGINDWGCGVRPLSSSAEDEGNTRIFSCAYDTMLAKLKGNYPKAEIWCLTLPFAVCRTEEGYIVPCRGGYHLNTYCEVIRNSAKKHGCRVIELYEQVKEMGTVKDVHPNADGMEKIASAVLEQI